MARTGPNMVFHFTASKQSFHIEDRGGYMTRNQCTARLLTDAMSFLQQRSGLRRDLRVPIYTGDISASTETNPYFTYAGDGSEAHGTRIPDFSFGGWPECGWPDYEATASAMVEAGRQNPQDDRLFWSGNMVTHWTRRRLVTDVARREHRVLANNLGWVERRDKTAAMLNVPLGSQYVSLPDHCRYRYLLDLQGVGYSARLKMLLFSGRPVFIQDRRWVEYWHQELEPFVHFVPVREDLEDLSQQLDWAESHPTQVAEIGRRGQLFAQQNLHYSHAVDRMAQCLVMTANSGDPSIAPTAT